MAFLLVLGGCILTVHNKGDKYFKLMYIALGILIYLEFRGNIQVFKTIDILINILIWITIAVPMTYFTIKKDVRNLAMVLCIQLIFILMGLIFTFGNLIN
ncbi:hypothetical protein [Clostridium sp. CF012]|uniref:hypothetical protein n=1 Tax=Clostridium sp. CF012 TaxID=2843319 RepID=UPI001C0AC7B9|nr:hypothetical protein [Clostridium sp. CF012]MBU3145116.1 hypothetical protein [Clostridium sp. CF012]